MFRRAELILVSVCLAMALVSTAWFGFAVQGPIAKEKFDHARPIASDHTETIEEAPWEWKDTCWNAPPPQSRGSDWIYDLFTPPEIFYDANSREFEVMAPAMPAMADDSGRIVAQNEAPFCLQLVAVKRAPFRLQLIGFIKTSDEHFGLFENTVNADIILEREGAILPQLGLLIEKFEVKAEEISSHELMPTHQTRATAVVRDRLTGETVKLSSAERYFDTRLQATLAIAGQTETRREVSKGDLLEVARETFEIDEIRMSPPEVVIICRPNEQEITDRRTLSLRELDQSTAKTPST
jgi:hypothetical protein